MPEPDSKPDYHGHRQRLRTRFLAKGGDALSDYELLELLLGLAIPRRDVKPLAKALLRKFGGFAGVISAESSQLAEVAGLGPAAVAALKSVQAGAARLTREQMLAKPVLSNWQALLDYCRATMAHQPREQFRILFLNQKNVLTHDELMQEGTINHAPVYPREVMRRALELSATAIILVHNHPSGDPTPSRDDIAMTKEIIEAGKRLGIAVHDHLVIGRHGHASFKSLGLI
mgnify:CR=1 FL=1